MSGTAGLEMQLAQVSGACALEDRRDGQWMTAPGLDVRGLAQLMVQAGARLSTMTALPADGGEIAVIYHYCLGGQTINVKTQTTGKALPSITPVTRQADWIEREIHDLYAVDFTEHPNPARLIRPPELKEGFFGE